MMQLIDNPFITQIIDALVWGPPYWPEISAGAAAVLCAAWLAVRIARRRRAEEEPQAETPPPAAEKEQEDIYETAKAEIRADREVTEALKKPVFEIPEEAEEPAEEEIPEEEEEEEEAEREEIEEAPQAAAPGAPALIVEEPPAEDFFSRLKRGLKKTQEGFLGRIDALIRGAKKLDEDLYEELEEALVTADLGVDTAYRLLEKIQKEGERGSLKNPMAARDLLRSEVGRMLEKSEAPLMVGDPKPFVIMVLGVNGVGKTTTIAKLAYKYKQQGLKVLLAAGDTFRAAAIEQLSVWAGRVGAEIVKHAADSDPSAVAFDAVKAARARGVDVVIVDTAGRLHTRIPLMEELKKVKRIIGREMEGAPHETLLVLDASTGQNAISQAQTFHEAIGVTGLVLTKLDGSSKGGVIVGISDKFKLPIRFIGIGEKMYDLTEFKAGPFVDALFARQDS